MAIYHWSIKIISGGKLQNWLKEEQESSDPTTLANHIMSVLSYKAQAGKSSISQSISNPKDASKMLNFLNANIIMDMVGLDVVFDTIYLPAYQ